MELIELFYDIEMFEGLNDRELKKLANIFEERVLGEGDVLFSQGDKADHLFLVKRGLFEVVVDSPTFTGEQVIRNLGLGQTVGEMSWIDGGARSATVRAVTAGTTTALVSFEALELLCKKNPKIGYRIFRNIAADLSFRLRQEAIVLGRESR